jgi:thioredoxin 1
MRFLKVDIDQSPRLAERFQIEGVPTLLMFRNGAVVQKQMGLLSKGFAQSAFKVFRQG